MGEEEKQKREFLSPDPSPSPDILRLPQRRLQKNPWTCLLVVNGPNKKFYKHVLLLRLRLMKNNNSLRLFNKHSFGYSPYRSEDL